MHTNKSRYENLKACLLAGGDCSWDGELLTLEASPSHAKTSYTRASLAQIDHRLLSVTDEVLRIHNCGLAMDLKTALVTTLRYWGGEKHVYSEETDLGLLQFEFAHIESLSGGLGIPTGNVEAVFCEYDTYTTEDKVKFAYLFSEREVTVPISWFDQYVPGSSGIIRSGIELGLNSYDLAHYAFNQATVATELALPLDLDLDLYSGHQTP